ncbi:hypothetical protein DFH09DRAFT_1304250 [Mycena vulgaris]|nr:hypothetical protein DFH09DRAFT_1304250 [Mycena vulgaris]
MKSAIVFCALSFAISAVDALPAHSNSNAERLARGLPPLPPRRRHGAKRTTPSSTPFHCDTKKTFCCSDLTASSSSSAKNILSVLGIPSSSSGDYIGTGCVAAIGNSCLIGTPATCCGNLFEVAAIDCTPGMTLFFPFFCGIACLFSRSCRLHIGLACPIVLVFPLRIVSGLVARKLCLAQQLGIVGVRSAVIFVGPLEQLAGANLFVRLAFEQRPEQLGTVGLYLAHILVGPFEQLGLCVCFSLVLVGPLQQLANSNFFVGLGSEQPPEQLCLVGVHPSFVLVGPLEQRSHQHGAVCFALSLVFVGLLEQRTQQLCVIGVHPSLVFVGPLKQQRSEQFRIQLRLCLSLVLLCFVRVGFPPLVVGPLEQQRSEQLSIVCQLCFTRVGLSLVVVCPLQQQRPEQLRIVCVSLPLVVVGSLEQPRIICVCVCLSFVVGRLQQLALGVAFE